MKKVALALCVALLVAGCGGQPIYNVTNHAIPVSAQKFPLDRIQSLIIEAGQTRSWKFERAGTGHLIATQTDTKFSATVDIYFDNSSYRISHKTTVGLKEKDGTIHAHYNFWIRNLEKDIEVRLANAA